VGDAGQAPGGVVLGDHGAFGEIGAGCYGGGFDDGVFLDVLDLFRLEWRSS
jgi:hypothetical protein